MLSLITHSHTLSLFSHTNSSHLRYPCMFSLTSRHSHSPIVIPHHSLIPYPLTPLSPISPIPHIPQLIDHHRSSPPITTYSLPNASTHDPNTIQRPNSTPNPPNSSPQSPKHTHHTHNDNSRTPLIYHTTQPIQSRRWDKPQGLAGQSQLIPSQYPLHTKSSTKDCIDNTISFNTIQIVFLYPKRIKYSYVKYILSLYK